MADQKFYLALDSHSQEVQSLIKDSSLLLGEISKVAQTDNEWKTLKDELHQIMQEIISDECQCECYKINLLKNALIPYIRQMHSRLILNRKRFHQIQMLLRILSFPSSRDDHPSNVLREIETIISSVDAEGGWWKSEFSSKMHHAVSLEWIPILTDNRKGLQNVASKLLFVGLVDLFRSGLFILPVITLLAEIALIVQKVNDKSGFSPENLIQLLKSSMLLIVVALFVRIIGLLPGLGYSASILGVFIFIVTSVDPILKLICPYVAPNMAKLSTFVQRMEALENELTNTMKRILVKVPTTHLTSENFISPSERVEELLSPDVIVDTSDTLELPSMDHRGLRKRKIA